MSTSVKASERLSLLAESIFSNQEKSLAFQKKNFLFFSQISDNLYNIAGKMGAQLTSLKELENQIIQEQKAVPQKTPTAEPQAVPVDQEGKETKKSKPSALKQLGILIPLYGALVYASSYIDKIVEFFKNPVEIITNLLGSIGEEIVSFFQEGSFFRDFITEAFDSAKNELLDTFENLKDIFKFIISDPLENLFNDIKIFFVDLALKGLNIVPDWLRGDSIRNLEKSIEGTKKDLQNKKQASIEEQSSRRADFEKRVEYKEAVKQAKEEGKQPSTEDLKQSKPSVEQQTTPAKPSLKQEPQTPSSEVEKEPKTELPKAADSSPSASAVSKPSATATEPSKQGMVGLVTKAFEEVGITNPFVRTALLANIEKESGFKPRDENLNYSSPERIKKVFPTAVRVARLSDDDLKQYTNNPQALAELVYGNKSPVGKLMGNLEPGDGFKYRGRGFIQITGKKNYDFYGKQIGIDLVKNPDLANDPIIAAKIAALFVKNGLKGRMDFKTQSEANRAVTQVIGGAGLDLSKGIGAEILAKVDKYSTQFADGGSSGYMVVSSPTTGQATSAASAEVNASKRQNNQTVINIDNTTTTGVKVAQQQLSQTVVARPVT